MKVYPKEFLLKDKSSVIIRPLLEGDGDLVQKFFSTIPREDLIIFKDDVTNWESLKLVREPELRESGQARDFCKERVIAKGTLHAQGLYWPHAAEVKLVVHPEYRGNGLGSQMFNLLLYEGLKHQFQKIIVRYIPDNISFMKILGHYGFEPETVLNYYVLDEATNEQKDLVIASYDLQNWERRFEFYTYVYGS
jgi:RimJ/RimL family protein N-acetyltransferase